VNLFQLAARAEACHAGRQTRQHEVGQNLRVEFDRVRAGIGLGEDIPFGRKNRAQIAEIEALVVGDQNFAPAHIEGGRKFAARIGHGRGTRRMGGLVSQATSQRQGGKIRRTLQIAVPPLDSRVGGSTSGA